jgi:hypothetical protein
VKENVAVLSGNAVKGRPRQKFLDQIKQVLEKSQVNPKHGSVYEEFDESRASDRCAGV